jgi:hypothetical protein
MNDKDTVNEELARLGLEELSRRRYNQGLADGRLEAMTSMRAEIKRQEREKKTQKRRKAK